MRNPTESRWSRLKRQLASDNWRLLTHPSSYRIELMKNERSPVRPAFKVGSSHAPAEVVKALDYLSASLQYGTLTVSPTFNLARALAFMDASDRPQWPAATFAAMRSRCTGIEFDNIDWMPARPLWHRILWHARFPKQVRRLIVNAVVYGVLSAGHTPVSRT